MNDRPNRIPPHITADRLNDDWIRSMRWHLPTNVDAFLDGLVTLPPAAKARAERPPATRDEEVAAVARFMQTGASLPMPTELRRALRERFADDLDGLLADQENPEIMLAKPPLSRMNSGIVSAKRSRNE